jgi:hypothetical protein
VLTLVKLGQRAPSGLPVETPSVRAPSGDTEGQVARLLLAADQAMKAEDWEGAVAKCDEALKVDPAQELARDKRQRAEAERKNRAAYENFARCGDKGDYDCAVASYGEVSEDSVYRQKGAARYAQVKKAYLRSHLDAAKRAKAASRCEEARQHVEAVMTVDEGNLEALDISKGCGAQTHPIVKPLLPPQHASRERPVVVASTKKEPKERPAEEDSVGAAAATNPAMDKILQDAQEAYVHGQYQVALDQAHRATKGGSKDQLIKAWRIIGLASCFLKDRTGATQAWSKLDQRGRQSLQYVCAKNQISVGSAP